MDEVTDISVMEVNSSLPDDGGELPDAVGNRSCQNTTTSQLCSNESNIVHCSVSVDDESHSDQRDAGHNVYVHDYRASDGHNTSKDSSQAAVSVKNGHGENVSTEFSLHRNASSHADANKSASIHCDNADVGTNNIEYTSDHHESDGVASDNSEYVPVLLDPIEHSDELSSAVATTASSNTSDDTDESVEFGGYTINRVRSDDSDGMERVAHAEMSANDQEENLSISRRMERARRKRQHSFLRQSSSENAVTESDSSSESDSDLDAKTSRLDAEDQDVSTDLPLDAWKPVTEIYRRQIGGFGGRQLFRNPQYFTRRAGSSVLLVSKLVTYDKHEVHEGCVNALHFNQTGSLIASGSDDLKVVIFDWINKRTFISFDTGHRSNVFQAKFLPLSGDCHLVTCARDGQIRLAQLSATGSCNRTKKLASHKQAAHKLALLNDSPHVFYSCGEDSVVFQIDLRQEQPNKCYITKENDRPIPLYSINANPSNSNEHCVGGRDQYIRIYDVRMIQANDDKKALIKKFCPHHLLTSDHKAHITCAVYNYNGTEIIGTYNDDDIYLFDAGHSDGAQHIHKYTGHRNNATVKGVNFYGSNSEFIVSGSDCGNVFLWHRETEKIVNYFHADDGGVVNVLEPHPHLPLLATSGLDNDIKLWMPTAEIPASLANLRKVTQKNQKEREIDRNEPDVIDSQMLWFLMHTLRRNAARHAASTSGGGLGFIFGSSDSGPSDDSDDVDENVDDNDDDDDDDDDDGGVEGGRDISHSQCTTS